MDACGDIHQPFDIHFLCNSQPVKGRKPAIAICGNPAGWAGAAAPSEGFAGSPCSSPTSRKRSQLSLQQRAASEKERRYGYSAGTGGTRARTAGEADGFQLYVQFDSRSAFTGI